MILTDGVLPVVAVGGTWSLTGGWWQPGSTFWQTLSQGGLTPALIGGEPFEWETGLGSSVKFWLSDAQRVSGWRYAGKALRYYLDHFDASQRIVVAHSHGGQLPFEAASVGFKIHRLITVGTPVRKDMRPTMMRALDHIGGWLHVCDAKKDGTAWWGGWGDGQVGNVRAFDVSHPHFHGNLCLDNIGHSGLLNDDTLLPLWQEKGLIDFLRGPHHG